MDTLSDAEQRFILHWGEMGTRWGINRSVAQVYALLYLAPRPRNAEEIAGILGIARSNVSTSLRELQGWRVVRVVHVLGDRRDHFATREDLWEMFRIILDERKRREIDPTLAVLSECVDSAGKRGARAAETHRRLAEMLGLFEAATSWYRQISRLPTPALIKFVRMGRRIPKALGLN